MDEEWKDIDGFNGLYQVSSLGNIKSLEKNVPYPRSPNRIRREKILKQYIDKYGYLVVRLSKNKEKYNLFTHRLVSQAFIPNLENKPQVNHKDGIKTNNFPYNLEWSTGSENMIHAYKTGLQVSLKGEKHPASRLKKSDIIEIRAIKNKTQREISIIYGVSFQHVSDIINRKSWTHI